MERPQAIAWAGSIALVGSASAFVLGSLLGGFGLGSSRMPLPPASSPPTPGGNHAAPATENPAAGPSPGGTRPQPEPSDARLPRSAADAQSPPDRALAAGTSPGLPASTVTAPASLTALQIDVKTDKGDISAPPHDSGKVGTEKARTSAPSNLDSIPCAIPATARPRLNKPNEISVSPGNADPREAIVQIQLLRNEKPARPGKAGTFGASGTLGHTRASDRSAAGGARTAAPADGLRRGSADGGDD